MHYEGTDVENYISQLPIDRIEAMQKLRITIKNNISPKFEETIIYGMIGYVVPHSLYLAGYHVTPELPLSFINLASQKEYHLSLSLRNIYVSEVLSWFESEYPKHVKTKLDMGKSCIRFKNVKTIPYDLIGELCRKISLEDFVNKYEEIIEVKK